METNEENEIDTELTMQYGMSLNCIDKFVFHADKYPKAEYSAVYWSLNPEAEAGHFLNELSRFYDALKSGTYEKAGKEKSFQDIHFFNHHDETVLPLSEYDDDLTRLFDTKEFRKGFMNLRIATPYGDFGLESNNKNLWRPKNGRMGVSSHQDISKPLAELISKTTKYSVKPEIIQPELADVFRYHQ